MLITLRPVEKWLWVLSHHTSLKIFFLFYCYKSEVMLLFFFAIFLCLSSYGPLYTRKDRVLFKQKKMCHFFSFLHKKYSKTCLRRPLKEKTKIGFQDRLSLNAGQKYCRMLQGEHSATLSTSLSFHLSLRSLFCLILSGFTV